MYQLLPKRSEGWNGRSCNFLERSVNLRPLRGEEQRPNFAQGEIWDAPQGNSVREGDRCIMEGHREPDRCWLSKKEYNPGIGWCGL